MVMWYLFGYFIVSLCMVMMLFISGDLKKLSSGNYNCPGSFISLYVMLLLVCIVNFISAYSIFKYITRRYQPSVREYIFKR